MKPTRFVALVLLLLASPAAVAQTSASLTGTTTTYNYSTAPWVVTSGVGTYPDGGGVATFNPISGTTPGTLVASSTVTFDVSPTLSQIAFNTPIQYILAPGTGGIAASSSGLTLNAASTAQNVTVSGAPISIAFGTQITASISGGGTNGLTKTGSGNLYLLPTSANTYTGGTHFNGGFTTVGGTAAVGDGVFGATGAGNDLSFNGGSVLFNITGGLTTARNVFIDVGGATLLTNTAATINGVISGSGTLNNVGFGGTALTLTGANTFTGAYVSRSTLAVLTLSGTGTLNSAASYDLTGTFNVTNATTNVNGRLNSTAPVVSRGASFTLTGNAGAASSEATGTVTLAGGVSYFTVTPNASQPTTLTTAGITRTNNSALFIRGTSLGATSAAGVAQVYATSAPTLVGGGGGAGSTTISIIPWASGNVSASATLNSSLVTYGATGFRPLATTEYAAAFGGNATDNVRLTGTNPSAGSGVTANAVVFAPSASTTLSGGPINITSGAFLYSPTAAVTGFVSANLNFGAAEGVISTSNTFVVSGAIAGSGGLTLNSYVGNTLYLAGANTYTGPTTFLRGTFQFSGTVTNDGTASPYGAGTSAASPLVFAPGTSTIFFNASAASVVNRDLIVQNSGPASVALGNFASTTYTLTVNGGVTLNGTSSLLLNGGASGATTAVGAVILNGTISGTGNVSDNGTYSVINGNNTYSGGTYIQTGTYAVGSNTAFGTGQITFSSTGTIRSADATAHTFANDLFLNATTSTFAGTGDLTFTGGVNLNGSRSVAVSSTSTNGVAFNGVVSNGSLTKTGTGLLALNSPTGNTYTGGTLISAGTLVVNNTSGSATGTGAVGVGSGGTLAGGNTSATSGIIGNATTGPVGVLAGGKLAPGTPGVTNGIGTLQALGNVTVTGGTGTTWAVALNPVAPNTPATAESAGTNVSQLALTNTSGVLNLVAASGTPIAFTVTNATGSGAFVTSVPVSYVIGTVATAGNIQTNGGTFNYDPTAYSFTAVGFLANTFSLSVQGTNLVLTFTPVPEPGFVLVVVAAVMGCVWVRRRATRAAAA